ncbi:MAG TPA: alpha/beta hydrolase [Pseudomonas sp.]|uniref:alpha/beta hydrolase n=1 Tax=Pseudomonas sp. TaxID=306 RepID=UPI002B482DF7|nr:alpha/beta hydrolase [Pseudomonas sp.]HKS13947.1 alpha/beta hydrolase [Pseudomonas sp.]
MSHDHLLHPAYRAFRDQPASHWSLQSLDAIRSRVDATFPSTPNARCEERWLQLGSKQRLRLCLYWPTPQGAATPALLYLHGGGFVLGRPEMADDYLADLAVELGALIVAVDYRLAPEHPFPAPLEDCYAALAWIFEQAQVLHVDTQRVILHGHSAGGGLAAALALLVRERAQYRVTGLVMVYPMLDHRTGSPACADSNPTTGSVGWSPVANQFCWSCLQGAYPVDDDRRMLFSPALAEDLHGLPPSFMAVGALDLFVDENLAFARGLSHAGVPVEFHLYPGVPHMFDQLPGPQTEQCLHDVRRALTVLCGSALDT